MTAGYITFPTAALAALLGPSTDPTTDTENLAIVRLSGYTRTDSLTRAATTLAIDSPRPWAVGVTKTGTVSYGGGAAMTGSGTLFSTELSPTANNENIFFDIPAGSDPKGEGYTHNMLYSAPTSNTSAPMNVTYGGFWAAKLGSLSGLSYRLETLTVNGSGINGVLEQLMYYDYSFVLYQQAYKHGATADAATMMANADAIARLWWDHPVNATARRVADPTNGGIVWPGSREACLGGLMAWALRGCPGAVKASPAATVTNVWQYCYDSAIAYWHQWLEGKGATDHIAFDTRDGGYALHWLVMLAQVHPTPAVQADCLTKAVDAAVNYFIRLQYPDGTFRATTFQWWDATLHANGYPAMQPFLVSLLIEALIDLHRAIRTNVTYAAQAATVLAAIKQGIAGLQLAYGGTPNHAGYTAVTGAGNAAVRGFTYALAGVDFGYDATTYAEAIPGDLNGLRWYDPKVGVQNDVIAGSTLADAIAAKRFLNSTSVHAPFYAAIYESDPTKRAAFLAFGDELLKAQWEYTDGDGFRSQWYTAAPKNKDSDEHMRAQMRGLAWRKLAVAGATNDDPSLFNPTSPGAATWLRRHRDTTEI